MNTPNLGIIYNFKNTNYSIFLFDNKDIILILGHELVCHSTAAFNALLNAFEQDRNAEHKSMWDYILNLIITPAEMTSEGVSTPKPLIIVIDALDECTDQSDAGDMLEIICWYSPMLPLKFFVTSCPKQQIQDVFYLEDTSKYLKFILHEIEKDIVSVDIAIYARDESTITTGAEWVSTSQYMQGRNQPSPQVLNGVCKRTYMKAPVVVWPKCPPIQNFILVIWLFSHTQLGIKKQVYSQIMCLYLVATITCI